MSSLGCRLDDPWLSHAWTSYRDVGGPWDVACLDIYWGTNVRRWPSLLSWALSPVANGVGGYKHRFLTSFMQLPRHVTLNFTGASWSIFVWVSGGQLSRSVECLTVFLVSEWGSDLKVKLVMLSLYGWSAECLNYTQIFAIFVRN